ncbi:hypothetical protein C0033_06260 [Clostridium sp. chh4-2]|uniref:hypothetical protein n=1 Tax=Clostridium sp. chh4-2 TaxID=2067550 RepID=UPI000CCDC1B3|nr:hypothetical protein [Clostridium sp. chh4-2]PNV63118.1 hypothetical protein C0033_06260 [Clostridium sp. chh4-2]
MKLIQKMNLKDRILRKQNKRILAGYLAILLTAFGVLPSFAYTQSPNYDETMYITMNPYGEFEESSVVKRFRITGAGEIKDYGNYKSVTNLTTHAEPETGEDGSVTFPLDGNEDLFYFEGQTDILPSALPWTIQVKYLLNGVERSAEELAGASGMVEISIDLIPNEQISDYYRNNMALTAAAVVDMDKALSVRAEGAQIQSMGNLNAVLFLVFPGEERHYTIAIGSDDFEFSGLVFMMIPLTLAQLDKVADLKEAKETLEDSADAVSDSLDILLDSMEQMQEGISGTVSGLRDLDQTRQIIQSTKDSVYEKADAARTDLDGLSATLKPFKEHTDEAQNALSDIKEKLDQLVYDLDDIGPKMGDLKDSVRYLRDNIDEIKKFLNSPEANMASNAFLQLLAKTQDDLDRVKSSQKSFVQAISGLGSAMAQINASSSSLRSYQALLSSLDDYSDYDPEDMEDLLDYLSDYMDEDAGIELINDLKTASASDADPIIPSNLQPALAAILQSTAGLAGNTEVTDDISSMISMTEQLLTLLGSHKDSFSSSMTDARDIADVIGDISNIGEDIISDIDDLDITLDYYYPEAISTLKDAGALTDAAAKGLDSLNLFLGSLEDQIKAVGEPLNSGTRKTLNGLADILEHANSGLAQTETVRQAKDTIKDTIDDKWKEYTEEKTTILNLDPEAKPVSMTSSKNPEPNTIQIILRTKELTKEDDDSSVTVDESFKPDGNVFHRIANIFRKIWEVICSLFS